MIKSFKYASRGIVSAFITQRNIRIHFVALIVVIVAGFYFGISNTEWVELILCSGMVISAEMINTSIEEIVNFISPEHHTKAGLIKDLSAGAVLLVAVASVVIACIIFIPKILLWL